MEWTIRTHNFGGHSKYLDIYHCNDNLDNYILFYSFADKYWFYKNKDISRKIPEDARCGFCREKIPNYIKFQAELLIR